jgi:hypothetical protein
MLVCSSALVTVKESIKLHSELPALPNFTLMTTIIEDLFIFFAFYLLYKLVFGFIVPVYKTTKQVRREMGNMQEAIRQQYQQQQAAQQQTERVQYQQTTNNKVDKGDYLDFEEIK